jgi:hypothetical protein
VASSTQAGLERRRHADIQRSLTIEYFSESELIVWLCPFRSGISFSSKEEGGMPLVRPVYGQATKSRWRMPWR